jgi:hypothetical protein
MLPLVIGSHTLARERPFGARAKREFDIGTASSRRILMILDII